MFCTQSATSSKYPLIFRHFTQPFLTRNLKADSQLSSETLSFTKKEIVDTDILVLGREGSYFVKKHSDSTNKYTEDDIINMLEFLVDNIFVVFGRGCFPTDSRHSHKLCPSSTFFCTHTKRTSYSLCSQLARKS